MKISEEQLCRAAVIADAMELALLPDKEIYSEHIFSEEFENNMQTLITKVKNNQIEPYQIHMGWQYYMRRGAAAILLCFLLTCFTMPDAVLAGYQKLVEVIETVITEYTEYRYRSNASVDATFTEIKLNYLPEGMTEVERERREDKLSILYGAGDLYFEINQELVMAGSGLTYIVDTENAQVEEIIINDSILEIVSKDEWIQFIWQYNEFLITGETNLSREEMLMVLEHLEI